jgi:hypothetical protein
MAGRDDSADPAVKPDDADEGVLYSPDALEATRMREQGLGMGAKDLSLQRDPAPPTTTQEFREVTGADAWDEVEADERKAGLPPDRRH